MKQHAFLIISCAVMASMMAAPPAQARNRTRALMAKSLNQMLKDTSKNPCSGKKGAHIEGGTGAHHKGGHWVC